MAKATVRVSSFAIYWPFLSIEPLFLQLPRGSSAPSSTACIEDIIYGQRKDEAGVGELHYCVRWFKYLYGQQD